VATPGNRVATPGNRVATPGNRVATPGNRVATPGNRVASAACCMPQLATVACRFDCAASSSADERCVRSNSPRLVAGPIVWRVRALCAQ
jgi:hypothetical protein